MLKQGRSYWLHGYCIQKIGRCNCTHVSAGLGLIYGLSRNFYMLPCSPIGILSFVAIKSIIPYINEGYLMGYEDSVAVSIGCAGEIIRMQHFDKTGVLGQKRVTC